MEAGSGKGTRTQVDRTSTSTPRDRVPPEVRKAWMPTALRLSAAGTASIVPVWLDLKKPAITWKRGEIDRQEIAATPAELEAWDWQFSNATHRLGEPIEEPASVLGWGRVFSKRWGVILVEFESMADGERYLPGVEPNVISGGGGPHYYLEWTDEIPEGTKLVDPDTGEQIGDVKGAANNVGLGYFAGQRDDDRWYTIVDVDRLLTDTPRELRELFAAQSSARSAAKAERSTGALAGGGGKASPAPHDQLVALREHPESFEFDAAVADHGRNTAVWLSLYATAILGMLDAVGDDELRAMTDRANELTGGTNTKGDVEPYTLDDARRSLAQVRDEENGYLMAEGVSADVAGAKMALRLAKVGFMPHMTEDMQTLLEEMARWPLACGRRMFGKARSSLAKALSWTEHRVGKTLKMLVNAGFIEKIALAPGARRRLRTHSTVWKLATPHLVRRWLDRTERKTMVVMAAAEFPSPTQVSLCKTRGGTAYPLTGPRPSPANAHDPTTPPPTNRTRAGPDPLAGLVEPNPT